MAEDLEVLGDGGGMSRYAVFEFDDAALFLAFLVNHREGFGDVTHLHGLHDTGNLRRQLAHLEARGAHALAGVGILCDIEHQAFIRTGIDIVGEARSGHLKGEHALADVLGDGIQTRESGIDIGLIHMRFLEDMAQLQLVAALVHELDDMIAELRLHNLRHLLGVVEAPGDIGEGGVQLHLAHIVHLAALTRRAGVLAVEDGQRGEAG